MGKNTEQRRVEIITQAGQADASINKLRAASRLLYNELQKLPQGSEEFRKAMDKWQSIDQRLKTAQREVKGLDDNMQKLNKSSTGWWSEMKKIGSGVAVGNMFTALGAEISSMMNAMISGKVKIADEMRDIAKSTGMTLTEVEGLNEEMKKIDTRSSSSDLRKLAYEAGKLGKTGKEEVAKFVEEMDKIKVALGEDLGDDAIIQIGKMTKVYEAGAMNIASAINSIGAASEASEQYLVDFASRMGGSARTAKISAPDILGYAAVLDQMGLQVEMSATALSNFTLSFIKDSAGFERAAGMRAGSLQKIIGEKGTNAGMLAFIEAMKNASGSEAEFLRRMEQVGIDGSRGAAVFLTLANNIDMVKQQQQLSNKAFTEGTSIIQEFNTKNEGFAANWDKIKKTIYGFFTDNVIIDGFEKLVNYMMDSRKEGTKLADAYDNQKTSLESLEKKVNPMLERYGQLKNKTELTKDEHTELQKIMNQLGEAVPGAITKFDMYGNAMEINAAKVKLFVENQKLALESMNREAIDGMLDQIENKHNKLKEINENLIKAKSRRDAIKSGDKFGGRGAKFTGDEVTASYNKAITELQKEAQAIKAEIDQDKARLQQLRGRNIPLPKTGTGNTGGGGGGGGGGDPTNATKDNTMSAAEFLAYDMKLAEEQLKLWKNKQELIFKQAYADNIITKEQYDAQMQSLDLDYLEGLRKQYVSYGKDTTEIDIKIADERIKVKKAAAKEETKLSKEQEKELLQIEKDKIDFLKKFSQTENEEGFKYKMQLLDEQLRMDLERYQLTEEQKLEVTKYYEDKKAELRHDKLMKTVQEFEQYYAQVNGIMRSGLDIVSNLENEELQTKKQNKDQQIAYIEEQHDRGVISEVMYKEQLKAINDKYEAEARDIKLKQWKRQQLASAAEATINTAVSVTKVLANPALAILTGIAGAAQVAAILTQPVPEFAAGGPTVDAVGQSGRKYRARRGAASGYHSSPTYIVGEAGGELVVPHWLYKAPAAMNLMGALEASIAQRSTAPLNGGGAADKMMLATIGELRDVLKSGVKIDWDQLGYNRYQENWNEAEDIARF